MKTSDEQPASGPNVHHAQLLDKDFARLANLVQQYSGIKMPPEKKQMLAGRLKKRLRARGMGSFSEYCDFLFSKEGQVIELPEMLNVVTTNKTDFFREPAHFGFIKNDMLPLWQQHYPHRQTFYAWSAGCSSGEEPYTLGMVLADYTARGQLFDFEITATDLSTTVLQKAVEAVYPMERIMPVAPEFRRRYLLKSKDKTRNLVRVGPYLRNKTRFRQLNLLTEPYRFPQRFDMIMCRNVLIYFERPNQEKVIKKLCERLQSGGFFFVGHSESITSMDLPLKQLRPTIYQKI